MHGIHPTKINEKIEIFNENAWTTSHKNNEKCAIFDENAWTIAR